MSAMNPEPMAENTTRLRTRPWTRIRRPCRASAMQELLRRMSGFQLRHLLLHDLHPRRRHHLVPARPVQRRSGDGTGLAARLSIRTRLRAGDGTGGIGVSTAGGFITGRRSSAAAAGWLTAWFSLAGPGHRDGGDQRRGLFAQSALDRLSDWIRPPYADPRRALAALRRRRSSRSPGRCSTTLGIKLTTRLTDFGGYLIFGVSVALTVAMLAYTPRFLEPSRLWTFIITSGLRGGGV